MFNHRNPRAHYHHRTITYMYQNKFIVRPYGIKIHRFILSEQNSNANQKSCANLKGVSAGVGPDTPGNSKLMKFT